MRLNVPDIDPYVHGLIKQHQAEHGHKNQKETIECLIIWAMRNIVTYKKCIHMTENGCELKMDIPGISIDDVEICDVHLTGTCTSYSEDRKFTCMAI